MFDFKRVSERGSTMRISDGPGEIIIHHILFTENGYIFTTDIYTNGCESSASLSRHLGFWHGRWWGRETSRACCGLEFDV